MNNMQTAVEDSTLDAQKHLFRYLLNIKAVMRACEDKEQTFPLEFFRQETEALMNGSQYIFSDWLLLIEDLMHKARNPAFA
jgi:hypothetical protein